MDVNGPEGQPLSDEDARALYAASVVARVVTRLIEKDVDPEYAEQILALKASRRIRVGEPSDNEDYEVTYLDTDEATSLPAGFDGLVADLFSAVDPKWIRSNAEGGSGTSSPGRPFVATPAGGRLPSKPSPHSLAVEECVRALRAYGLHTDLLLKKKEVRDQIASCVLTYRRRPLSLHVLSNLSDELAYLGGKELQASIDSGAMPVEELARLVRPYYERVRTSKKAGGFVGALAAVREMPEKHEAGFNPRLVGWIALRDVLGDQPHRDLCKLYGMPKQFPHSISTLLRFASERPRFKRKHSPEGLIGVAVLLAHSEAGQELGRKRKLRSHKGQSRRGWNVSAFPSDAFLDAVKERTGASRSTVRTVLQGAAFELPPEMYLV